MGIQQIEAGMLAKSLAGHDKDSCYVVWKANDLYAWLTDGRLKPIEKPKKKKLKHVQIVYAIPENLKVKLSCMETIRNEDIKYAIKMYTQSGMNK